jgi:hypothetical protein
MTTDLLHDRLTQVEVFLSFELASKRLDPTAYVDAMQALADAQLALVRAGTPGAERPMRAASDAELRFQRREQRNQRARACLHAAIAASLCMADGGEDEAGDWLLRLSRSLPVIPQRAA